jgi:ABC-type lipoprotein export system ATPase subunit
MLTCGNVGKIYTAERGPVVAIRGVDLEVRRGEFATIVGRSGSGKSSLMAMIGGLTRPSEGTVRIDDVDVWSLGDDDLTDFRSRRIGFVFQFASLLPTLRIIDNVALPALLGRRTDADAAYGRAAELLARLGLARHLEAYPAELSSGQQRRGSIARALINGPSLLLADEPTSDLDEETEADILAEFRDLNRDARMTVIMVTHNLHLAEQADRVFHIADGALVS